MLLNEAFDLPAPESRNLSPTDARQEWLLSSCVIVDPSLANPQPFRDLVDGQQTIGVRRLRRALQISIQAVSWPSCCMGGGGGHKTTPVKLPFGPSRARCCGLGPLRRLSSDTD